MDNADIARVLDEVADLLEIQGANPFRIRAYRNAVRTVETATEPLRRMVAEGAPLTELPAIGKDIASHITELVGTGQLALIEELGKEIPRSLVELMRLPGVGPKKAKKIWQDLGVATVGALEEAATQGRLAALEGFGERSQEKILAGIQTLHRRGGRVGIGEADRIIQPLLDHLRRAPGLDRLEAAGSYRRRRDTVGDLDLLAVASPAEPVMEHFVSYGGIERVEARGETKTTAVLRSGMQVDLRVVPRQSFGAALVYFTGSKEHNIRLRKIGVERGLRISEYGVFQVGKKRAAEENEERDPFSGKFIAGREEEEVYAAVGLHWPPPELREDRGEIEAASAGGLPRLITLNDLRGDLQMHSTWSDGRSTIEEMLIACVQRGYKYFAITDHSKALAMVRGLDAVRLRQQWKEISRIAPRHPEIRILRSMEVDILADGSLDLEDELLNELDLVLVSVHSRFDLPPAQQTERILRAIRHPAVRILGHPTGRRIGKREPMAFDVDEVLRAAAELGVAVELNSHPERLDLKDTHLMRAKELGCKIVISTDAHRPGELELIRYGVEQARRAWLTKEDVLNTLPLEKFLKALRKN